MSKLNTIEEAIEDIRAGKIVIAVDDEDRENEGDFVTAARKLCPRVETGVFQAHMAVSLVNDGPVTLLVESPPR